MFDGRDRNSQKCRLVPARRPTWNGWCDWSSRGKTPSKGGVDRQQGILPLNETKGVQAYSSEERVWVDNLRGPWQSVTVLVHRLSEIQTPGFERFLNKAIESFNANIKRMETKPEDLMPWKLSGEKWHLGEKGFPPGRKVYWDRAVLKQALDIVRAAVPDVEIKWDNRVAIMLRLPGCRKGWAHWRTKDNKALYRRFLGKRDSSI